MDQSQKPELINLAIQRLIEAKRSTKTISDMFVNSNDEDAEYQLILSGLLSELEMLKGDDVLKQSEASSPQEVATCAVPEIKSENVDDNHVDNGCTESGTDEIVKELKKLRRQNFVTHCLLSVMIVLTLAWQLSEVSLIMKVKNGFSHPFRTFGSMVLGMLKGPDTNGGHQEDKEHQLEPPTLPSFKIPEMPHMDLPNLGSNNEQS